VASEVAASRKTFATRAARIRLGCLLRLAGSGHAGPGEARSRRHAVGWRVVPHIGGERRQTGAHVGTRDLGQLGTHGGWRWVRGVHGARVPGMLRSVGRVWAIHDKGRMDLGLAGVLLVCHAGRTALVVQHSANAHSSGRWRL
jgi:hypothetical protein